MCLCWGAWGVEEENKRKKEKERRKVKHISEEKEPKVYETGFVVFHLNGF